MGTKQLALELKARPVELKARPEWGGRRDGAGRPRGPKPPMPHASRQKFPRHVPCHVTLRMRDDVPSLRTASFVREAERTLSEACERGNARLVHYSIQSDHLHLVVEATGREALANAMKSIGARLARAVNRVFARRGPVLSDRYHLRVLRSPLEVRRALAYVLLNARRHAAQRRRKLTKGAIDPASSGRWFDGWRRASPAKSPTPSAGQPVAPARTWLLRIGWRSRGLIDLDEVPGGAAAGHAHWRPAARS